MTVNDIDLSKPMTFIWPDLQVTFHNGSVVHAIRNGIEVAPEAFFDVGGEALGRMWELRAQIEREKPKPVRVSVDLSPNGRFWTSEGRGGHGEQTLFIEMERAAARRMAIDLIVATDTDIPSFDA